MSGDHPMIPDFELLKRLGSGGMGDVFLARQHGAYGFKKLVALKVIQAEKFEKASFRAMFMDEARLLAQLDHPAITQVHAFGESQGMLYLVMEYVPGPTFHELLMSGVALPRLICAAMVARVCRGLHAAHELKNIEGQSLRVVHRDVTPQNLVFTFDGRVKILDFGIALMRERTAPVTGAGYIRGKPTYFAPEQVEGVPVDRRTDIYSLSIVLYELLTQRKLFVREELSWESWIQAAHNIVPPSRFSGTLPKGLDEVVMRGLSFEPRGRFQDAREMAMGLEAVVEREGCESLESFAERELRVSRGAHDEELRRLLGGSAISTASERPPETLVERNPVLIGEAVPLGRGDEPAGSAEIIPARTAKLEAPRAHDSLEHEDTLPRLVGGRASSTIDRDLPGMLREASVFAGPRPSGGRWRRGVIALTVVMLVGIGLAFVLTKSSAPGGSGGVASARTQARLSAELERRGGESVDEAPPEEDRPPPAAMPIVDSQRLESRPPADSERRIVIPETRIVEPAAAPARLMQSSPKPGTRKRKIPTPKPVASERPRREIQDGLYEKW